MFSNDRHKMIKLTDQIGQVDADYICNCLPSYSMIAISFQILPIVLIFHGEIQKLTKKIMNKKIPLGCCGQKLVEIRARLTPGQRQFRGQLGSHLLVIGG